MQPQITVDTATLKDLLKRDVEMISQKRNAYVAQIKGLDNMLDKPRATYDMKRLLDSPGVTTYLESLRDLASLEQDLADRQLLALRERLKRIESDIVIPGSVPGAIIS